MLQYNIILQEKTTFHSNLWRMRWLELFSGGMQAATTRTIPLDNKVIIVERLELVSDNSSISITGSVVVTKLERGVLGVLSGRGIRGIPGKLLYSLPLYHDRYSFLLARYSIPVTVPWYRYLAGLFSKEGRSLGAV